MPFRPSPPCSTAHTPCSWASRTCSNRSSASSSAAAAVVLVTLLVRAALIPVGISQAKAERTRARLAPQLAELQRKHQKNPERLQREMMSLYPAEGTTPLAGCLPMLIQAPIVGIIYALFILPTIAGHPNELLTHTFFGVPLGSSLAGSIASGTVDARRAARLRHRHRDDRRGRRGDAAGVPSARPRASPTAAAGSGAGASAVARSRTRPRCACSACCSSSPP